MSQMQDVRFFFSDGMLQAADMNPALDSANTQDLTIPRKAAAVSNQEQATKEIASGRAARKIPPLIFVAIAAGGLLLVNLMQKKAA